jgi:transposase
MLSFPAAIRVYLCTVACDMRRSFDGLSMMAEHIIRCDPYAGHLLVFCNRRSDRLKILYWDRDGWAIWYKRLEEGTFQFPFSATGRRELAAWELGVLFIRVWFLGALSESAFSLRFSPPTIVGKYR